MINLCSVLWELCRHMFSTYPSILENINPEYCSSKSCLLNYHLESCLAEGQIGKFIQFEFIEQTYACSTKSITLRCCNINIGLS